MLHKPDPAECKLVFQHLINHPVRERMERLVIFPAKRFSFPDAGNIAYHDRMDLILDAIIPEFCGCLVNEVPYRMALFLVKRMHSL